MGTTRETLEQFVERRRCAHLSHEETEKELYEALGERDGLLKAAGVNGAAFTKLFREINRLKESRIRTVATMIRAMDALESDASLENRQEAWELLRAQFDDVEEEERLKIEALKR